MNNFLAEPKIRLPWTCMTLNLTVLERGLHCPMVAISPSVILLKAGEQWAGIFDDAFDIFDIFLQNEDNLFLL